MATLSVMPRYPIRHSSTSMYLYEPPAFAVGQEGQLVGQDMQRVAERWRGTSAYVAALFTGHNEASHSGRLLTASLACLFVGLAISTAGVALDISEIFAPIAGIVCLSAYAFMMRWIAKNRSNSGVYWFVNRIRTSLAYEGDPGSYKG